MYRIILDENSYIISYSIVTDSEHEKEVPGGVIVEQIPSWDSIEHMKSYKYIDGKFELDSDKYLKELNNCKCEKSKGSISDEIELLKEKLSESDYMIIKMYECSLVGKETEYDISALHDERQEIRDRINELETKLITEDE